MGEERIFMLPINAKRARRVVAATGVVGLGLSIPCLLSGTANAAPVSTWDKVAQCESSGDWSINTGNGFYGGLQFTSSTWAAYGGHSYAPQANQATKAQQISVAEKVLADQGPGAWPVCSVKAGLTKGGAPAQVDTGAAAAKPAAAAPQQSAPRHAAPQQAAPQQSAPQQAAPAAAETYTVQAGDWLSTIAQSHHVDGGWQKLYELNKSVLTEGPDMIYPGQKLALGNVATAAPQSAPATTPSSWNTGRRSAPAAPKPAAAKASTTAAKAVTGSKAAAVNFALSKVGQAYIYGGTGNGGWDCSGLTQAAFRQVGISLPRVAADQADYSTRVSLDNLQPGDLLFWSSNGANSGVHHVAMYIGDGKYVEAANPRAGVRVMAVADWAPDFAGRV
ncbi:transglycosylase family protein [Kitasatospora paracochleata]|uniref:Cell wall-associated NlpC family hydrolase n=1 Tax=Kitasatospora paracochleata TaxID=58354 RepID=A0ABT1J4F3_9ACTN|nr:transglycosylase family protein [Kitasatospora paracochleata]MCP2312309.1 cell wall-associated NlpC family hydrolase [Kitasatospora paracochleata]